MIILIIVINILIYVLKTSRKTPSMVIENLSKDFLHRLEEKTLK